MENKKDGERKKEERYYQCDVCGFKFRAIKPPRMCPYCGKIGTIRPVKDAKAILKESERY